MQRFLREPNTDGAAAEQAARAFSDGLALIERHFPPSVAQAYAIARAGADGTLEWWTRQEGKVTPFAALSADQQRELLARYAEHQGQLESLAQTLEARGLSEQAATVRGLRSAPDPARLHSVEGRLLITHWSEPRAPAPVPVVVPRRRWWWWLLALLLLALLLGLLWWWLMRRPVAPVMPPAAPVVHTAPEPVAPPAPEPAPPEPVVEPPPAPKPKPQPKPDPQPGWPTELVFVLDSSAGMARPAGADSPLRQQLARHEIERIVGGLPARTETHLVRYAGKSCAAPVHNGPYKANQRDALLTQLRQTSSVGASALAESLKVAASKVDGRQRDALIFVFAGGPDGCGGDVCATAREIHRSKPRLRINVVDLTGDKSLDACAAKITGGESYNWGARNRDTPGVDLSKEAARMLAP